MNYLINHSSPSTASMFINTGVGRRQKELWVEDGPLPGPGA